jgi:hypothetical protein
MKKGSACLVAGIRETHSVIESERIDDSSYAQVWEFRNDYTRDKGLPRI